MRTTYHAELSALSAQVGEMCGLAADAMERATQALLGATSSVAEQVIADHEHIAAMSKRTEARDQTARHPATGRQRPEDDPERDPCQRRHRAHGCAGRARRQHLAVAASRMRAA